MHWLNKALSLAAVSSLCVACGGNEFARAMPKADNVRINVPQTEQALVVGEQSQFMLHTKNLANGINGSVLWVLGILDAVVHQPPTERDETRAVWGPSEPKGLEQLSWRLTVEKVAEGDFAYHLDARLKGKTEETDFVTILTGTAQPTADDKGTGTLTVDMGAKRGLVAEAGDCNDGTIEVAYDASSEPRMLTVDFVQVLNICPEQGGDPDGDPADAHYQYTETQDGAGTLDFDIVQNMHKPEENKPLEETLGIHSRWLATGAGRADVRVSDGEVPADLAANLPNTTETSVVVSECWDDLFALTYGDTSPTELALMFDHAETGDASACVFAEAEIPDA